MQITNQSSFKITISLTTFYGKVIDVVFEAEKTAFNWPPILPFRWVNGFFICYLFLSPEVINLFVMLIFSANSKQCQYFFIEKHWQNEKRRT